MAWRNGIAPAVLCLAAACPAAAGSSPTAKRELRTYLERTLEAPELDFESAEVDLDGKGQKEVVVHLAGSRFCGSGGCKTLVLQRTPRGYRRVMAASVTRPPIRVLMTRTYGWRDIGVMVAGGGILAEHEARMRFDGRRYPSNPTVPPAEPMRGVSGTVVIE